jgi:uncharacterized protein YfcZ (UPF0381/DUF406 family)
MNKETGTIVEGSDLKKMVEGMSKSEARDFLKNYHQLAEDEMTERQKSELQVSKHDNKSKLGKTWTEIRKARRAKNMQAKRSRRKNRK